MRDLILFGIQGAGKGTQSKRIAEHFGYTIFEAGGELRRLASTDTLLGRKIKSIIDAGNLVPDEVIMEMVEEFIQEYGKSGAVIFDGIPRNESQAQLFGTLMKQEGRRPLGLYIHLSDDDALNRLTKRRICSQCKKVFPASYSASVCDVCGAPLTRRADDTLDSIKNRLQHFHHDTMPVIEAYRTNNDLVEVNGAQDIEKLTQEIIDKLQRHS